MKQMNLKTYIILPFLSIIFCFNVHAQEKKLAKAEESFKRFAFVDAREIYLQVAESGYQSLDLFKKLGDSYYFNAQLEEAATWYEKLTNTYPDELDPEYLFRYSQSLKSVERYDEADQVMEKFNTLTGSDQRAEFFMNTRDYLNFIETQSGKFRLLKLNMNSKFSDYAPSFNNQGQLIFASSRGGNTGMTKTLHEWNEMPFLDLYASDIIEKNGILKTPKKLKGKINTKFHESSTSFSADGKTVYFTRNNYIKRKLGGNTEGTILLKIYRATFENDKWSNIEELPFNSDEYSVAHPALSADGTKLYFASDMPDSRGLSDLYVIDVNSDGTFGNPINLGDKINTEGRETFPYISNSGRLYFASDGHVGLGGLDVFVAVQEDGGFSIPYNVGKPVNSSEDDFTFVLNENTKIGYFSSNRNGGKGNDDIYSFKQTEELITKCNQYVSGVVTDAASKEQLVEAEVILMDENNTELKRTVTDEKGKYKFDLECDTPYIIRATMVEYNPTERILATNNALEYEHNLALQLGEGGLTGGKEVKPGDDLAKLLQLETIYFDLDKFAIRPDAEVELQKIIATLKKYPELKIDVRSHTDSRSSGAYNMFLSERRATSTVKYIIEKGGIPRSRVTGRGYGETVLLNKCKNNVPCTDEEHQLNRRSEFIVIK